MIKRGNPGYFLFNLHYLQQTIEITKERVDSVFGKEKEIQESNSLVFLGFFLLLLVVNNFVGNRLSCGNSTPLKIQLCQLLALHC